MKKQPKPKKNNSKPIADLVIDDIKDRKKLGKKRYGTYLQANNQRDALLDAYEEILDLSQYIRQLIEERVYNHNCERCLELRIKTGKGTL